MGRNAYVLKKLKKLNKNNIYPDIADFRKELKNVSAECILVLQKYEYLMVANNNLGYAITPKGEEYLRTRLYRNWGIVGTISVVVGAITAVIFHYV